MIIIYKELIKRYIRNITINDIKKYALENNEILTDTEASIIYNHIKTYYPELLEKNITSFTTLKQNLRSDLFEKIVLLYNEYSKYL